MDSQQKVDIPQSYICPITMQLMVDPVIDPDGHSYERKAIEDWLKKNSESPITRNPLAIGDLRPNRALQELIEEFKKKNGVKEAPPQEKNEGKQEIKKEIDVKLQVIANKNGTALVSVIPPKDAARSPCDICCVVDVSGSMGSEASLSSAKQSEGNGLTILDIVKHALKTIIQNLSAQDRLSIVTFSNTAHVEVKLTKMTDQNKKTAIAAVERMDPDGSTNLWDGLHTGLELLQKRDSGKENKAAVFLLTDGEPNIVPPRGHLPMLQKYKDQNKLVSVINTFGFGYSLDSELLHDLAVEGNGMYSFIPDSSFVGTIFVNALSNFLASMVNNVTLSVEPVNGAKMADNRVSGGFPITTAEWGALIQFGSLQYGQTKDAAVQLTLPTDLSLPFLRATLKYEGVEVVVEGSKVEDSKDALIQGFRLKFVDTIRDAMKLMKDNKTSDAKKLFEDLAKEIQSSSVAKDSYVAALLKDITGQATEAVSKTEFYKKWGRHYLPSLMGAHLHQYCNNFKDPGVQFYGGKLFSSLRDKLDETFCKLPPPKPSGHVSNPSHKVQSMATYHNSSAPCFAGNCQVLMADGLLKEIQHLKKGDKILTPSGKKVAIVCIVKTYCAQNVTDLVLFDNGLLVTPWHPIRVNGKWSFPQDIIPAETRPCSAVYSFLLESEHVMIINNVECVTLAHGFQEDVVQHPYFGTHKVVEDLQKMKGWESGLVELNSGCMIKDPHSGLISKLVQTRELSNEMSSQQSNNKTILA